MMNPILLDRCARVDYETFVEGIRAIAPPLAEIQPCWERTPDAVKDAWRKAAQATLDEAAKGA
jgi:hypothetical protein